MMFDEEPEPDPHDECRAEIQQKTRHAETSWQQMLKAEAERDELRVKVEILKASVNHHKDATVRALMQTRDHFFGSALTGLLAEPESARTAKVSVETAWRLADMALAKREE